MNKATKHKNLLGSLISHIDNFENHFKNKKLFSVLFLGSDFSMLNFNMEIQKVYNQIKNDYQQHPFIPIDYPKSITEEFWEYHEEAIVIPPVIGCLYFIFDEQKQLLYIGKSKTIEFALKSHLIKKTSRSTSSILDAIKEMVCNRNEKRIYIKVLDLEPIELSGTIKPFLIRDFQPLLARRLS